MEGALKALQGRLTRHHPMTLLLSEESGSPLSFVDSRKDDVSRYLAGETFPKTDP